MTFQIQLLIGPLSWLKDMFCPLPDVDTPNMQAGSIFYSVLTEYGLRSFLHRSCFSVAQRDHELLRLLQPFDEREEPVTVSYLSVLGGSG